MRSFEDFPVGLEVPLGPYPVTREEVLAYAAAFDPLPFHLDEAAARDSLLGGLAASGWHTCAMMMRMMVDGFLRDSTSQGSPGVDFIRWLRPVRPGDTLTGRMTVLEARRSRSRPQIGIAKLRNELVNQEGDPVLEGEYTLLLRTREAAA
ncbi:enoyl-CoA hydratase [Aureimonas endophytica]|uniref:Enoyl-CoA hydratase n=1 Tax=Aureimonas endophytica TaxID=2027858 RepID=A0A916ZYJ7_9HYPH|nr:MaoC family dehydratase [Aureimonas endophytica]GGE19194.1 enoyl-CoA hydratase [Aureimonas endophytica]